MKLYHGCAGPVIRVSDVEMAAAWICNHLFFEEVQTDVNRDERILVNGTCAVYLVAGEQVPGRIKVKRETSGEDGSTGDSSEAEGHIVCDMVSDGVMTLEVYQFTDRSVYRLDEEALAGIAYEGGWKESPGGVYFIGTEEPV